MLSSRTEAFFFTPFPRKPVGKDRQDEKNSQD